MGKEHCDRRADDLKPPPNRPQGVNRSCRQTDVIGYDYLDAAKAIVLQPHQRPDLADIRYGSLP